MLKIIKISFFLLLTVALNAQKAKPIVSVKSITGCQVCAIYQNCKSGLIYEFQNIDTTGLKCSIKGGRIIEFKDNKIVYFVADSSRIVITFSNKKQIITKESFFTKPIPSPHIEFTSEIGRIFKDFAYLSKLESYKVSIIVDSTFKTNNKDDAFYGYEKLIIHLIKDNKVIITTGSFQFAKSKAKKGDRILVTVSNVYRKDYMGIKHFLEPEYIVGSYILK